MDVFGLVHKECNNYAFMWMNSRLHVLIKILIIDVFSQWVRIPLLSVSPETMQWNVIDGQFKEMSVLLSMHLHPFKFIDKMTMRSLFFLVGITCGCIYEQNANDRAMALCIQEVQNAHIFQTISIIAPANFTKHVNIMKALLSEIA